MPKKSYWFGGLVMIVFAGMIMWVAHLQSVTLPLAVLILLWLFLLCGVWSIALSVFRQSNDSALSWLFGALTALGFAIFAFVVAWQERDGWSGGIPFIPERWNQAVARILFALGGLLSLVFAVASFREALRRWRSR